MPTGFVPISGLRKPEAEKNDFVPLSELRNQALPDSPPVQMSGEEAEASAALSSQQQQMTPRVAFESPPTAVDEILEQTIPEGKCGIITGGAAVSQYEVNRPCAAQVKRVDISLPVKRAQMVLRKSALASTSTMMEREVLKEVIEEDHRRWGGCIMLPASVFFFVLYLLAVLMHEDTTYTYIANQPARDFLRGPLEEVNSREDVFPFLINTYLPTFFSQYDIQKQPLPRDRWSMVGEYSQVLGSVQLELQRSVKETCSDKLASEIPCYPTYKLSEEPYGSSLSSLPNVMTSASGSPWSLDNNWTWFNASSPERSILACADEGFSVNCKPASRRLIGFREEIGQKLPDPDPSAGMYRFHLDTRHEYGVLYNRLQYLKARGWLDAQTTVVTLKAILLNNQLAGVPRVVFVRVNFFFSRGGGVYTSIKVEGKTLDFFVSDLCYVFDALFVLTLTIRSISMVVTLIRARRRRKLQTLFNATFLFSFLCNMMSWVNITMFLLTETQLGKVRGSVEAYFADPTTQLSDEIYSATESMILTYISYTRPLVAYANFLFLCQCFIALQWQPRLAVVTETLLACSSDLFHYLIVLLLTMVAFGISGMVIFGRRVADFAVVHAAVAYCFKIAIESEYDWPTLSDTQEWMTAFVWVVLYLLLVVMLMVNMVLAIIMDVYAEVRMHSGDNMTIFQHLTYIYRKLYYRHQWIPDDQLMDQVCEMPQHVTLLEVRQAFPEMHHYQLEYLQSQCLNKASRISRVGLNKTYTSQITAAILFGLEEISSNLERLKSRGWMSKGMEVGGDGDREWVKDVFSSIAVQSHWMNLTAKQISTLKLRMEGVTAEEEDRRWREEKLKAGRVVKTRASQVAPD